MGEIWVQKLRYDVAEQERAVLMTACDVPDNSCVLGWRAKLMVNQG